MRAAGSLRWWDDAPAFATCYHPHAERYLMCPQVEKCGYCGAVRFTEELGTQARWWAPETKTWPPPLGQMADRSGPLPR